MTGLFDFVLIQFPGAAINPGVVPALIDLVASESVRILDLVVIRKAGDGTPAYVEIDGLEDDSRDLFYELNGEYDGLLSNDDLLLAAASMPCDSTALAVVWEDLRSARFVDAVHHVDGEVLAFDRLPHSILRQAMSAAAS